MSLSSGAQRLHNLLSWFIKQGKRAFPKLAWLAQRLEVCTRTIKRWLRELRPEALSMQYHGPCGAEFFPVNVPDYVPDYVPDSRPLPLGCKITQERLKKHHLDDGVCGGDELIRKTAGFERLSEGDRRYLQELRRAGVEQQVIVAGVAVGRARKMTSRRAGEPIRSLRYFGATIAEATSLPPGYSAYVEHWLRKRQA